MASGGQFPGGGGIYNGAGAALTVSSSSFSANSGGLNPDSAGGAIDNLGTATVIDTTFDGNSARAAGGIENRGTLTISGSTFTNNRNAAVLAPGGALTNDSGGILTMTSSTLYGNIGSAGGALANFGNATLTSITVTGNSTPNPGVNGGLYVYSGTVLLDNSIVAGNVSVSTFGTRPSDILLGPSGTVDSASSYNVIGTGGSGGLIDGVNGNQVGVADAGLGPLADHGGPTQTMAPLAGSPALNTATRPSWGLRTSGG
jgi:hypothetical protein